MSEDLRARDRRARKLAQREFSRPLVLEAGAGTGKTATLVARVLSWSLHLGWEKAKSREESHEGLPDEDRIAASVLDRIVAITFTERAAAEMAGRIAEGLSSLQAGTPPIGFAREGLPLTNEEILTRSEALIRHIDHVRVTTIHAFCRSILALNPLEAGLHPAFEVDADFHKTQEVIDATLTEYATKHSSSLPPDLELLYAHQIGPTVFREILGRLMSDGAQGDDLPEEAYPTQAVLEVQKEIHVRAQKLLAAADPLLRNAKGSLKAALRVMDEFEVLLPNLEGPLTAEELKEAVDEFHSSTALARLGKWGNGTFTKAELAQLNLLGQEFEQECNELFKRIQVVLRWNPILLPPLLRVIGPLLDSVRESCRQQGLVQFSELLRKARNTLVHNPGIAGDFQSRMDQFMVDEFQDTDPMQCDVVRSLALTGPPSQRPGLFLVGDPKQSIYGWRQADLQAYREFVDEVLANGGIREVLAVNYRSVPAILDEVERVHAPLMNQTPEFSPVFERLLPSPDNENAPGFDAPPWKPVEYWPNWTLGTDGTLDPNTKAEPGREEEGLGIAKDLIRLRKEEGIQWRDVAILMRTTTVMETYLRPLREAGIPYVVERDRNYFQRREIIDAISLLRVVCDPNDHVALVGLLRSPFVGVPDAALAPLWAAGFPEKMAHTRGGAPWASSLEHAIAEAKVHTPTVPGLERIEGWDAYLHVAMLQIQTLRETWQRGQIPELMDGLRNAFFQEITDASVFLGNHRLANLDRLERSLIALLEEADRSEGDILGALKSGVIERRSEEEGVPGDEGTDAIRILTIHKSKGLTFDHVYLVNVASESKVPAGTKTVRVVSSHGKPAANLWNWPTASWHEVENAEDDRESGERIRTLYVAMTRPKSRLVILGNFNPEPQVHHPRDVKSHGKLLERRFTTHSALNPAGRAEHQDQLGTRWWYPALAPALPHNHVAETESASAPRWTLASAKKDSTALQTHRGQSDERMSHSLLQTASSLGKEQTPNPLETTPLLSTRAGTSLGSSVGTAIHRFFEELNPQDPSSYAEVRGCIPDWLDELPAPDKKRAVANAWALIDRLEESETLNKFRSINIAARELPVLVARSESGLETTVSGTIDLLYQEANGDYVVADYKTDRVPSDQTLEEYGARYAEQGKIYVQAIQQALGLPSPPRFELWFLRNDTLIPLFQ